MENNNVKKHNAAESLLIALLLALAGGYLDIYSYLARGKVFANTQTGNLVLLGYNIATGNISKAIYYLLSIFSFISGICLAKVVEFKFKERRIFYWLHMTLSIEMIILLLVMFIPEGEWNVLANIMVSFVCALQVQSFRKVNGQSYSTIMFTGNLKNIADQFSHYYITKEHKALQSGCLYLSITISFVIGGWLGALLTIEYEQKAVGMVDFILMIIFSLLYVDRKSIDHERKI